MSKIFIRSLFSASGKFSSMEQKIHNGVTIDLVYISGCALSFRSLFIMVYMENKCCVCATGEFLTGLDKAEQCC